ncbi:hypothetical protein GCM10022239_11670 [Leifsonia bigeumensis]|uniref:Restriction endonuclease type IV Mrr domain-containing protein n=1 Tax=Leifsonella bigeumensis TaxID=433643 RepID=A0ABP7FE93_9MICO
MEAFEQFVALAMETEGLVVSGALKFPVRRQTRKAGYAEFQTHGFEVDLIGANRERLVLATVKSFFGSRGVVAEQVSGESPTHSGWYALLNNPDVRGAVTRSAAERFGYDVNQLEIRLYVGRFAGGHEQRVRAWCDSQLVGGSPIRVVGAHEVVDIVRKVATSTTYRDNPVLATLKVLTATGSLVTGK